MDSFDPGSDEDLEDLYENAPCGYLSLGPNGRIVKVNATLCEWLGRQKADLLGERMQDLLNVAGSIFYETHFAPLLRMQGFFNEVALDLVLPGGEKLPVLANARERRDDHDRVRFTRVTMFQAPHRRRFERELVDAQAAEREARRQLEELNATLQERIVAEEELSALREQFIAVLGHDIRNPVSAVDAGVKMLLRDGWTEKSPRILSLMMSSVGRMNGLIDNVLDLARSRLGGGISLQLETGRPLLPTLELVVDEIRVAHPCREIVASFDVDEDVAVDHARIAQMFSNLLSNAVTHGAEDKPVWIEGSAHDGTLELSIANAGDPIAPEMLPHLFMPFRRGDVRRNAQGLGLGLYIASQIAQAHGGRIDVHSDEQTRFVFRMPAKGS